MQVTKVGAVMLGVLLATLTLAGIGQAQDMATIQGTIQAVDCSTKALEVKTADGSQYKVYAVPASTAVFVNSQSVNFCSLQQYVGSTATVSLVPNGSLLMVKRVDVSTTAAPGSRQDQPSTLIHGMPDWAKYAVGAVLVGALIYFGTRGSSAQRQQPYYQCPDGYYRPSC